MVAPARTDHRDAAVCVEPAGRHEALRELAGPRVLRGLLLLACASAAIGAAQLDGPAAPYVADPELGRLLRAMALLKAALIVPALVVVLWRFAWPLSLPLAAAYVAGPALCVGGSVAIWQLASVASAAVFFHVGLVALVFAGVADRQGLARLPVRGR